MVASHEAAAYPSLLVRRILPKSSPVVVLTVAAETAVSGQGLAARARRWLLDGADLLTVYASEQRAALQELLPSTRASFLPLGVDTAFFSPSEHVQRTEDILAVGTNEGKDYPTLVKALPDDRSLIIVTDRKNMEQTMPHIGSKDVRFRSNVPIEELRELYKRCKLMVLPLRNARMSTGQTVLLENLSLGTPIIVTDVPCIRDYTNNAPVVLVQEGDVAAMREAIEYLPKKPPKGGLFSFDAMSSARELDMLMRQVLEPRK